MKIEIVHNKQGLSSYYLGLELYMPLTAVKVTHEYFWA